jgi:hypothetical protein
MYSADAEYNRRRGNVAPHNITPPLIKADYALSSGPRILVASRTAEEIQVISQGNAACHVGRITDMIKRRPQGPALRAAHEPCEAGYCCVSCCGGRPYRCSKLLISCSERTSNVLRRSLCLIDLAAHCCDRRSISSERSINVWICCLSLRSSGIALSPATKCSCGRQGNKRAPEAIQAQKSAARKVRTARACSFPSSQAARFQSGLRSLRVSQIDPGCCDQSSPALPACAPTAGLCRPRRRVQHPGRLKKAKSSQGS